MASNSSWFRRFASNSGTNFAKLLNPLQKSNVVQCEENKRDRQDFSCVVKKFHNLAGPTSEVKPEPVPAQIADELNSRLNFSKLIGTPEDTGSSASKHSVANSSLNSIASSSSSIRGTPPPNLGLFPDTKEGHYEFGYRIGTAMKRQINKFCFEDEWYVYFSDSTMLRRTKFWKLENKIAWKKSFKN